MKKLFLVTAVFFLMMIAHSEAQPGQNELKVKKGPALQSQISFKTLCVTKVPPCFPVNLKSKTRKWKSEMAASTKGYGFARLRACKPSAQWLNMQAPYSFQGYYRHIKQLIYAAPATLATRPSLILPAESNKDKDDNGVNIELSRKATLSLDFGADPSDDGTEILADNSGQDFDISVGLSFDLR
jgi:hypothetical protein